MLVLRHNPSLPNLDASSKAPPLRLRSSSYQSYNTIPSKQFTHSPFEQVSSNYCEASWLPLAADGSQPADTSTTSSTNSNYLPSHTLSSISPLKGPTIHARTLHTPNGSPSAPHPPLPSHQHPASLGQHLLEPNIRSVAAQPPTHHLHHPLSETRDQRQQHRQSSQHSVTPVLPYSNSASFSANRRRCSTGSGWEHRGDILAEPLRDLSLNTAGDQNASHVEQDYSVFSNPFNKYHVATRSISSDVVSDPLLHSRAAQTCLHSPPSHMAPEEEHGAVPPASRTYSSVSPPGNAVKKRSRRRYDETEHLYHSSWSGCPKGYGSRIHLSAHIVMQRHGSKRTSAEFKELKKEWRKAKKNVSERIARLERAEECFNMRSEKVALPYPSQSYKQPSRPLYGPGIPGPEMGQQPAVGEAMSRYPPSTETPSMRPQPLQQQHGYTISGAAHLPCPVVPTTPIPSWPEKSIQYEGVTPPRQGSPTHIPAQAAYDYERERQEESWTAPSLPESPRPGEEANSERERNEEVEGKGKGEVNDNGREKEGKGDGVRLGVGRYCFALTFVVGLQFVGVLVVARVLN